MDCVYTSNTLLSTNRTDSNYVAESAGEATVDPEADESIIVASPLPMEMASPATSDRESTTSHKRPKRKTDKDQDEFLEAFNRLVNKTEAERNPATHFALSLVPDILLIDTPLQGLMKRDVLNVILDYQGKSGSTVQQEASTGRQCQPQPPPAQYPTTPYSYGGPTNPLPPNCIPPYPLQQQVRPGMQGGWGVGTQGAWGRTSGWSTPSPIPSPTSPRQDSDHSEHGEGTHFFPL